MARPKDLLSGDVEVDETYVGGEEAGVRGRQTEKKSIVVIACEMHGRQAIGRIRLTKVSDVKGPTLVGFVKAAVAPASHVHTDAWGGYNKLADEGFEHSAMNLSASPDPAHVVMPRVHRVASLLKRTILAVQQGSVSPEHLDAYVDEFVFRFNRRHARSRGLLWYRLIEFCVEAAPAPYGAIRGGQSLVHRM